MIWPCPGSIFTWSQQVSSLDIPWDGPEVSRNTFLKCINQYFPYYLPANPLKPGHVKRQLMLLNPLRLNTSLCSFMFISVHWFRSTKKRCLRVNIRSLDHGMPNTPSWNHSTLVLLLTSIGIQWCIGSFPFISDPIF